jgi:type IV secretory pathway VirB3-like protein
MIKKLLFILLPVALFLLISTAVLSLSFLNIKYTYEPVLIGTSLDYLVTNTYSMAWVFYCTSNISFIVIYIVYLLILNRISKKKQSLSSQ